jgi:DMSO/TMAO reductase YedYZ molybdopterin-dependent catalytic subunit
MVSSNRPVCRRELLKMLAASSAAAAFGELRGFAQQLPAAQRPLPPFTGPGPNRYWNSIGAYVSYPEKAPLILLTDRPVQLETPRHYFLSPFTANSAFYVRWHLDGIPNQIDLSLWRLRVEGNVTKPLLLSFDDLLRSFPATSMAAVNQCSGNSRSRFQPRVAGGQWGNGAMGNAQWSGVKLRDLLAAAGVKPGSVQVQFEGIERGKGPEGLGSNEFQKSLDLADGVVDQCIVAYSMNGAPLPMLNGFPVRLIVPGYFATYWVKALTWIRVLEKPDENFWMKTGYRIPDTPRGNTTPGEVKAGSVKTVPITRMPVRSFLVSPDGAAKLLAHLAVQLQGIAFSGSGRIAKVEVQTDRGAPWREAKLGEDYGDYSFRQWQLPWTPERAGKYAIGVRATDVRGNQQTDEPLWNPGGYLWNEIERQEVMVGATR